MGTSEYRGIVESQLGWESWRNSERNMFNWHNVDHESHIKSTIFWDITPCSPLKVSKRFGGTYRPHLHGRRISQARHQRERRWQAERYTRIPEDSTLHNHSCENLKLIRSHRVPNTRLRSKKPASNHRSYDTAYQNGYH
jgi:hypothetical protein